MLNRRYNRFGSRVCVFFLPHDAYLTWRNSLDTYCPLLPRRQGDAHVAPRVPARGTRTRSRPWRVSLLISLQNVSLEPCEWTRYWRRENIPEIRFRLPGRRSVLTQKADPTESTWVELRLLIFTESGRNAFKCKNFCRMVRDTRQSFPSRDATTIPWII